MNEQAERRTLEQERAAFAWDKVQQLKVDLGEKAGDATMYIRRLPAMTFGNGLGQTLAFLLAQAAGDSNKPAFKVYQILAEWLIRHRQIYAGELDKLIKTIADNDRYQYQLAQEEVWALLNWLKKFADAFLPKEGSKLVENEGK